ncbi:MAG: glycosyltransferase family 2 protein [Candidatus Binatia bacterium]
MSDAFAGGNDTGVSLSVVVPAYNEQNAIDAILERLLAQREALRRVGIGTYEIVVVDDGSRDRTAERVAAHPDVRLVRHVRNQGYGAALKTGFAAATGEWLAFLDADGTYPAEHLPALFAAARDGAADLIVGSRMMGTESGMPLVRRVGNTIFATLLTLVSGRRVSDSASGMRVFRRSALSALYPLPDGLNFTPVMSVRALYEGLRVIETPIPYQERVGQSKLSVAKDGLRFLRSIVWTAALYNPVGIFGALGVALLVLAGILGLPPVVFYLRNRSVPEDQIYRLFTVPIIATAGINVGIFGLMSGAIFNLVPTVRTSARALPARVQRGLASAGAGLLLAGAALMAPAFVEWVRTAHITYHWSYFAAGGTLILVGLQLSTWFVLLTMVSELAKRTELIRQDSRLD